MDEATARTSARAWGMLTFSFAGRKPECRPSIAFDPAKRLSP
ncbi:MAG TPA: hypothetical protein VF800_27885 [Telluria sp.]|jgi:hypothetical protein